MSKDVYLGRSCEDGIAFDALADQCLKFREQILPLLEAAERSDLSYARYDEAYNIWLEELHRDVVSHLVWTDRIDETRTLTSN